MSRDNFDKQVGKLLRDAEMPVPPGAWNAIRNTLNTNQAPQSFGFVAALIAATLLLSALGTYSALKHNDNFTEVAQLGTPTAVNSASIDEQSTPSLDTGHSDAAAHSQGVPVADDNILSSQVGANSSNQETQPFETGENEDENEQLVAHSIEQAPASVSREASNLSSAESLAVAEPHSVVAQSHDLIKPTETHAKEVAPAFRLKASIQAENLTGYAPFEIDFKALGNYEEVEWDFGPLGKSSKTQTSLTFDRPGTYTVVLYAFGEGREMVSDMVTIEVHEGSNLVVPDSFTPNGDGINDTFKAEGVNIETFELTVIDERGKALFQTRNINEPWVYQGYANSTMQVYFAVIKARGIDGKDYRIKQRINIIF